MNRREAIAALTSLPGLARISRADVKPSDVLVVEVDGHVTEGHAAYIQEMLAQIWPGQKVLVLGSGMHLKVLSQAEAPKG